MRHRHPDSWLALAFCVAASGAAGCSRTGLLFEPPPPEACGNALDDDRDGEIDEGCPCVFGSIEACYDGPEGTEGVGVCAAGTRTCVGDDVWGDCEGAVRPSDETCVGGQDEDCDGHVDCDDEDCDDAANCEITDCTPFCAVEECDGRDNNGEGRVDEGRVCDGIEGPCPAVGAIRICDAYCGVHQRCRNDGSWGPCTVDGQGPVPQCDEHEDCPRHSWCDYGSCVLGTPCDSDGECVGFFPGSGTRCIEDQGVCVTDCYAHSDCDRPYVCDLGYCVPDPYAP